MAGGSAGEYAQAAKNAGADAFVTGEMRYHDCVALAQEGFATLQAGHDATERVVLEPLMERVSLELGKINVHIPMMLSER